MRVLVLALALVAASLPARAKTGGFGIGAQLGYGLPIGLTAQLPLGPNDALQVGAGVDLFCGRACTGGLVLTGDKLFLYPNVIGERANVRFVPYWGVGAEVGIGNPFGLGARVPAGISVRPNSAPVDFFVEAAATLLLLPDVTFGINGAVGARYWF